QTKPVRSFDITHSVAELLCTAALGAQPAHGVTAGGSITFQLQSLEGAAAAWSFHNDVVVTVRFGDPPEPTFFDDSFRPRLAFPSNGSALSISQLTLEDAGTYTAKSAGGKTTFTLHVYGESLSPLVTCAAHNCSAGICLYALHCTASGAGTGNVSYTWSMGSLRRAGPTVLVEEAALEELLLTCTAQNPVSSRNVSISSAAALCAGESHGRAGEGPDPVRDKGISPSESSWGSCIGKGRAGLQGTHFHCHPLEASALLPPPMGQNQGCKAMLYLHPDPHQTPPAPLSLL
uniref:Uncharacterized protein n=1 Tax=Melopsittacus undulatus TaxID=13146 RepID=A0A8V5GXI5_MELUD